MWSQRTGAARLMYGSGGLLYLKYGTVPGGGRGKKKVLKYATMASMPGFWEIPVAEGIFGSMGLFYGAPLFT